MKQNLSRLASYMFIINKLSRRQKYVPAKELMNYVETHMYLRDFESTTAVRTLQRDIKDISRIFSIEIKTTGVTVII